jgi:hypothetical protein
MLEQGAGRVLGQLAVEQRDQLELVDAAFRSVHDGYPSRARSLRTPWCTQERTVPTGTSHSSAISS